MEVKEVKWWQHCNLKERRLRKLNTEKVHLVMIAYEHSFFFFFWCYVSLSVCDDCGLC